jgi:hypothetical protein
MKLVALTFEELVPSLYAVESSLFLKTFHIGPWISTGILILPPYKTKLAANARENSLAYFVIQGRVKVTVNDDSFAVAKAGHFIILPGKREWLSILSYDNIHFDHSVSRQHVSIFK